MDQAMICKPIGTKLHEDGRSLHQNVVLAIGSFDSIYKNRNNASRAVA